MCYFKISNLHKIEQVSPPHAREELNTNITVLYD